MIGINDSSLQLCAPFSRLPRHSGSVRLTRAKWGSVFLYWTMFLLLGSHQYLNNEAKERLNLFPMLPVFYPAFRLFLQIHFHKN